MTIRKKLIFGFVIMIILTLTTAFSIFNQMTKVESKYDDTLTLALPQLNAVSSIRNAISQEASSLQSYLLSDRSALESISQSQDTIAANIRALESQFQRQEAQDILDALQQDIAMFEQSVSETLRYFEENGQIAATAYFLSSTVPARDQAVAVGEQLDDLVQVLFADAQKEAENLMATARWISILSVVASIILGIVITFIMSRMIAQPIVSLQKSVRTIASGDLREEDLKVQSKDEIGQLTQSFNEMKTTIRRLIMSLSTNATQLSASAEELSASTEEMTASIQDVALRSTHTRNNAQSSAQAAKESAFAMDETSQAISRVAESSQALHIAASDTSTVAQTGGQHLTEAQAQIQTIYDATKTTTALLQTLAAQSSEIENISRVITSISDQTNLLALNAAIEAARAGEHGKGFAVVADEVRKLAEESNASASKIVSLTADIQQNTKNVEQSMQQSLHSVEQGVQVIETANLSFHDIVEAVETMKDQISEVSAVTEQISASAQQVSASVQEMANQSIVAADDTNATTEAMQHQLEAIQEVTHVSQDLTHRAEDLQSAIHQFKI